MINTYKTLVLSNLHLEANPTEYNRLGRFLRLHTADRIILCGTILSFEGFENNKSAIVKVMEFFSTLNSLSDAYGTEIIVVQDNVSELSSQLISLFGRSIYRSSQYTLESPKGRKLLIVQGDIAILLETRLGKWLSRSRQGRYLLKRLMGLMDRWKVSMNATQIDLMGLIQEEEDGPSLEALMAEFAIKQGYAGVITAFSHRPAIHQSDAFTFMNSGSWYHHQCALVEDFNHEWSLLYFKETENLSESLVSSK